MPPNRCIIESKWLFKKKRDSRSRACPVAWGYTQITGVDFTKNYPQVVTDVTLCIIILMLLINKLDSETIDVATSFLYPLQEDEIYMNILEVMEELIEEDYAYKYILTLIKCIYGLVHAAR